MASSSGSPKALVCPICLLTFSRLQVTWHDEQGQTVEPPKPAPRTLSMIAKYVLTGEPEQLQTRDAKAQADFMATGSRPRCPDGHELPPGILERPSLLIALIGQASSGKSVYLATVVDEIVSLGRLSGMLNFSLDSFSQVSFANRFERFLGRRVEAPPATRQADGTPLAPVLLRVESAGGEDFNLLIFDGDGSLQTDTTMQARYNRAVFIADAFIFLAPPSSLPTARRKPGRERPDARQESLGTGAAIAAVLEARRRENPTGAGLVGCLAVTKADDLLVDAVPSLSDLFGDQAYEDFDSVSELVDFISDDSHLIREYLVQVGGRGLVTKLENYFDHTSYHFVSCLVDGQIDSDGQFVNGRDPRRVLDPIVSILRSAHLLSETQEDLD